MYPAIHLCFSFCFAVFCLSAERKCIHAFHDIFLDFEWTKLQSFSISFLQESCNIPCLRLNSYLYMFQCSIWGLSPIEIHLYKSILCHIRTVSKMESIVCFIQVIGLKRVKSFHHYHSSLQKGQRATLEPDILPQFVLRG